MQQLHTPMTSSTTTYHDVDYINDKYNGAANLGTGQQGKGNPRCSSDIANRVHTLRYRDLREIPTLKTTSVDPREQPCSQLQPVSMCTGTANANAGLSGWYSAVPAQGKHGADSILRFRPAGSVRGATNVLSYQGDEGLPDELRGPNYPNHAMNVGHQGGYAGIAQAAHAGRGDAFTVNPLPLRSAC